MTDEQKARKVCEAIVSNKEEFKALIRSLEYVDYFEQITVGIMRDLSKFYDTITYTDHDTFYRLKINRFRRYPRNCGYRRLWNSIILIIDSGILL